MKTFRYLAIILVVASMLGCVGLTPQQQSTLSGGAIGATGGAVLGAISGGSPTVGAVLGGGAGALAGYVIGSQPSRYHHRYRY